MKFLITGFPPFPGRPVNPTLQILDSATGLMSDFADHEIICEVLPVEYAGVEMEFERFIEQHRPDVVVSFGVGRHQAHLRIEECGVNLDDAFIPDNAGELRQSVPIIKQGPEQLWNLLNIKELVLSLSGAGIAAEISQDAGRYVCNHLLYFATYLQQIQNRAFQFLFIHVPDVENGFDVQMTARALKMMLHWFILTADSSESVPQQDESNR